MCGWASVSTTPVRFWRAFVSSPGDATSIAGCSWWASSSDFQTTLSFWRWCGPDSRLPSTEGGSSRERSAARFSRATSRSCQTARRNQTRLFSSFQGCERQQAGAVVDDGSEAERDSDRKTRGCGKAERGEDQKLCPLLHAEHAGHDESDEA